MTRKNALNVCNSFLKELSQIDCGIFMESQNKTYFGEFEKITFFDGDGAIKHCDMLLVMDDGRLAGCGTHDELIKNCRTYREICASQGVTE